MQKFMTNKISLMKESVCVLEGCVCGTCASVCMYVCVFLDSVSSLLVLWGWNSLVIPINSQLAKTSDSIISN